MNARKVKKLTPNSIANLVEPTEAWHDSLWVRAEDYDSLLADFEALRTHLAAPKQEPKHPGYVIGSHWLETAYSRVCAGEAEADVLRDCGWERVDEALRREAERYRWLKVRVEDYDGQACFPQVPYPAPIPDRSPFDAVDAAIDAAMGEKR